MEGLSTGGRREGTKRAGGGQDRTFTEIPEATEEVLEGSGKTRSGFLLMMTTMKGVSVNKAVFGCLCISCETDVQRSF